MIHGSLLASNASCWRSGIRECVMVPAGCRSISGGSKHVGRQTLTAHVNSFCHPSWVALKGREAIKQWSHYAATMSVFGREIVVFFFSSCIRPATNRHEHCIESNLLKVDTSRCSLV